MLSDLVLIDHLVETGLAAEVVLHLKPQPYYVSDAVTADLVGCLHRLAATTGSAAREELRRIGQRLIANHAELRTSNSELLARGWANALDVDRYVTETRDDGVAILVDQPRELAAALGEAGGATAARSLHVVDLMMKAIAIRDGTTSPAEATVVWRAVVTILEDENAADAFHSEYTSEAYEQACRRLGVLQSMGRVGSALDNAAAEAFNSTVKVEYIHRHRFATRIEARLKISTWIVDFYNLRRRHSACDGMSPIDYEHFMAEARRAEAA